MSSSVRIGTALVALLVLTSCGSSGSDDTPGDQTFQMAINGDPGALDPMQTSLGVAQRVLYFAYEPLVIFSSDGEVTGQLADRWDVTPTSVTFELRDNITCTDGTELTADDVAANFAFAADPDNNSRYLGELPAGLEVQADNDARTVTLTIPEADSFLLYKTGAVLIVCPAGLEDPDTLRTETDGTGLYTLAEAVPDDRYTFEKRDDGAGNPADDESGSRPPPQRVVVRIITDETTAANLFLSGELHMVSVTGPDRSRIEPEADTVVEAKAPTGLMWFNQKNGHPGADPAVREALVKGLDRGAISEVMTGGYGVQPESLVTITPNPCQSKTVADTLPSFDPDKANALLDQAGWLRGSDGIRAKDGTPLKIKFIYNVELGKAVVSAAELLRENWLELGVDVSLEGVKPAGLSSVVYETGVWDAGWLPVTVGIPSEFVPRVSGPTPPEGANFASIDNKTYMNDAATARELALEDACDYWDSAEQALFENFDLVPIVDETIPTFGRDVQFELASGVVRPESIRMN